MSVGITVSVRFQGGKNTKGQVLHDFTQRPSYSDKQKEKFNHLVDLGNGLKSMDDVKSFIKAQGTEVIKFYNDNRTGRNRWKKSMTPHKQGLISFGGGFYSIQNEVDKLALDEKAKAYVLDFCSSHNCRPGYLVRHEDESTTHYHFMVTNLNETICKPLRFQRQDLSEQQTRVAEVFEPMLLPFGKSFSRGKKKGEHFEAAKKEHPRRLGESIKDWHRRVWSTTNLIHRSVKQLHHDLPKEIEMLKVQKKDKQDEVSNLEGLFAYAHQEYDKLEQKAHKARMKLEIAQRDETTTEQNLSKLKKRVETYNNRVSEKITALNEYQYRIDSSVEEIHDLDSKVQRLTEVKNGLLDEVSDLDIKVKSAISGIKKPIPEPNPIKLKVLVEHEPSNFGHDKVVTKTASVYSKQQVDELIEQIQPARYAEIHYKQEKARLKEELEEQIAIQKSAMKPVFQKLSEGFFTGSAQRRKSTKKITEITDYAFYCLILADDDWRFIEQDQLWVKELDEPPTFFVKGENLDKVAIMLAAKVWDWSNKNGETAFDFSGDPRVLMKANEILRENKNEFGKSVMLIGDEETQREVKKLNQANKPNQPRRTRGF